MHGNDVECERMYA